MAASPTARAKHGAANRVRKVGRPPRVKAADTRRRILDVARGVYAERGYEAATNREIADLAHMTTAALYYHFPSKQDLYLAVHDDARKQVYDRFEEVLDPEGGFGFETSILELIPKPIGEIDAMASPVAPRMGAFRSR